MKNVLNAVCPSRQILTSTPWLNLNFLRTATAIGLGLALVGTAASVRLPVSVETQAYIVQGTDLAAATAAVRATGGAITHELGIIRAVGARLTLAQRDDLRSRAAVRLYDDWRVETANKPTGTDDAADDGPEESDEPDIGETSHVTAVAADSLHAAGITGKGVTLAVLDTGFFKQRSLVRDTQNKPRVLAQYDALAGAQIRAREETDGNGHGAHVAGISLNSRLSRETGQYRGVAPDANLVVVKAFDEEGKGSYADVIRGLDWLVANKNTYKVRVLNLSFSAPPQSHYWDDPLNQAVMAAWQAGIVVVASAGNTGPTPMSIGVPGNVPYVITVGAMTDNHTPEDRSDDRLTSFSSTGPTAEGFVKPEVIAPGGHVLAPMSRQSLIAREHPEFHDKFVYFAMSGTSQSAAVVSGVAALLLQADPVPQSRRRQMPADGDRPGGAGRRRQPGLLGVPAGRRAGERP